MTVAEVVKMRALDLFCKAGGASMGLYRAGFDVVGVDIEMQPRYPFQFMRFDALEILTHDLRQFDFIWASPPCQAASTLKALHPGKEYPQLIPATREKLKTSGVPYVIENVMGAPLINPIKLCGSSFNLGVRRHRLFEASFPIDAPACRHDLQLEPIDVSGTGARRLGARVDGRGGNSRKPRNLDEARAAMGIDWMNRRELSQAIPPAFAEHIGRAALVHISALRAAA